MFDFILLMCLISMLVGLPLLFTGVRVWCTNTEKSWLVRGFAALFVAFATLLLGLSVVLFVGWWVD
ncbi:hypothetical protein Q5H92_00475 [Hymenobacter sp. M29]|uniref:Uncharacterized protein n=1 Tax=Hymenobacter mellowenesis TaxID=3063995 RepID=A0ABT9A4Q1_9BACT|nr:hypothetical protein [Hymenobacter sp. M29]MDO7844814.1 hypothetical protein [Hymenobacter sp. M29]